MRVSVFGPRKLTDEDTNTIQTFWKLFRSKYKDIVYVHGGSKGAQQEILDLEIVEYFNKDIILFKPWNLLNNKLTYTVDMMFYRNKQILDNSDVVIVFELQDKDQLLWIADYCNKNNIFLLKARGNVK